MRVVSVETLGRRLGGGRRPQPRVVASGNHAAPRALLHVADASLESFRLFMLNAPDGIPDRPEVVHETAFVGPGMRGRPALAYVPSRLSLVPSLLQHRLVPDIVLLNCSPPRDGLVSLGIEVDVLPAAVEAARVNGGLVVAQLNPRMPYTYGDAQLSIDDIDLAIDADEPLGIVDRPSTTATHRRIAEHIAARIQDGVTIQTGIGAIPSSALELLHSRRGLRIWTEMFSDALLGLARSGALADAPVTTSFAAGSAELYDWLDLNPGVVFARTERTNDPSVISRQPRMTSINAALQVDLFAEANASYVGGRIYSGIGGQCDFVVGALHSEGGQALIALPSWHERSDRSTIVPRLDGPSTSFQHTAVVTEHGVADIWGRSQSEQARELIEHAADPRWRDRLRADAASLGLGGPMVTPDVTFGTAAPQLAASTLGA
jgi:acyl-CoA hydrolase